MGLGNQTWKVWWILTNQSPGQMAQYMGGVTGRENRRHLSSRDHHKAPPRNNKIPLLMYKEYYSFFCIPRDDVEPKMCNIPS